MTNTATLVKRLQAIEAKRGRPALVIDAVVIGGAPIDGAVIVIGGDWKPNHDQHNGIIEAA